MLFGVLLFLRLTTNDRDVHLASVKETDSSPLWSAACHDEILRMMMKCISQNSCHRCGTW